MNVKGKIYKTSQIANNVLLFFPFTFWPLPIKYHTRNASIIYGIKSWVARNQIAPLPLKAHLTRLTYGSK